MAYVPFPGLSEAERLAVQEPINWTKAGVAPAAMTNIVPLATPRLTMMADEPVWRTDGHGPDLHMTGKPVRAISGIQAAYIAQRFVHRVSSAHWQMIARDQWTVAARYDRHRPLWRIDLDDESGTRLYIAAGTGEVVLDTTRRERGWNWVGAVPHWIYLTALRRDQPLWRQVIIWTSGVGIIGAVSGMWIGILRARLRHRYARRRITPYRGWSKWHHVAGLIGGTTLMTWIVSGWLSVDPNHWFASPGLPASAYRAFAGEAPTMRDVDLRRLAGIPAAAGMTELRLRRVEGHAILDLHGPHGRSLLLDAASLKPLLFDERSLVRAANRMIPDSKIVVIDRIAAEDDYYYSHDHSLALPILRLVFDDPPRTWIYIDPKAGEVVLETDSTRRAYRWWFDALHCLDFKGLAAMRPVWDIILWILCVLGLVVSVSGVVIGWKRLFRA